MKFQKKIILALGILNFASVAFGSDAIQKHFDGETLRPEELTRKIEVCGADSILHDSTGNFSPKTTGWFEGYSKALVDPHEAFLAKVLMIQKAKKSIDISTYIFSVDEASNAYMEQLRLAIARGVNVRFMIDASGSMGEAMKDQYRHLRALIEARKQDAESRSSNVNPGTVDMVIFHPMIRARSILSHFDNRLFSHDLLSSETTLNWDRRSHDKIIIIDKELPGETMAIVGGRNIDNSYYGIPRVDDKTYEDMEVLMKDVPRTSTGKNIANTLEQHFQDLLCSKGNRWLSLERFDDELEKIDLESATDLLTKKALKDFNGALKLVLAKSEMVELFAKMNSENFLEKDLQLSKLHSGNEIQNLKRRLTKVMVDPDANFVEDLPNGDSIYAQTFKLIAQADRTIDVCTPYIFISKNERECLKHWAMAKSGRQIRVLSNSAATSDSALAMATFDKETAPEFMKSGPYECRIDGHIIRGNFDNRDHKVKVYELGRLDNVIFKNELIKGRKAEATAYYGKLHAKFGIIDGRYSFVGSDNLDERSRHLNSETTFFIENEKVASDLTQAFDSLAKRSYMYDDPDLGVMLSLKAVHKRVEEMKALDRIFKTLPSSAFAN